MSGTTGPVRLADRLRELGTEVGMCATGRDAALWLSALESLAVEAEALERDRAAWRDSIKRVGAEAASWTWTDAATGEYAEPTSDAIMWCAERVKAALNGSG